MKNQCNSYGTMDSSDQERLLFNNNGIGSKQDDSSVTHNPLLEPRSIDTFLHQATMASSTSLSQDKDKSFLDWFSRKRHPYPYYLSILIPLGIANCSDAAEILCLSYMLSDPQFQSSILHDDFAGKGGMLSGAVFAGMLMGGMVFGSLGDTYFVGGRKNILLFGLFFNAISGILSAFANNVWMLTSLRTLAGLGIGASVPPLFTLVTELAAPNQRGFCITFVASFWMIGSLFVAVLAMLVLPNSLSSASHSNSSSTSETWETYMISPWRIFAVLCAIPSIVGFILVLKFIPESPRYLASVQHRYEDAAQVVNNIANKLRTHPQDDSEQTNLEPITCQELYIFYPSFTQQENELEEGELQVQDGSNDNTSYSSNSSLSTTSSMTKISSFCFQCKNTFSQTFHELAHSIQHLYVDSDLRNGVTLPLNVLWFSLCFGSYGLLTWINTLFEIVRLDNVLFNSFLFAFANLPGNIISAIFVDRIGSKSILVASMLLSAVSLLSLMFWAAQVGKNQESSSPTVMQTIGIVSSACAFQMFTISGWNMIDCITGESFPTSVRSSGIGICTACGRVGAMLAQFVNGALLGAQSPVLMLVTASISLSIGAMVPFMMKSQDKLSQPLTDQVAHPSLVAHHKNTEGKGKELIC